MYLGRIVEAGPAARVVRAPRHPYTKALLSVVPRRDPRDRTGRQVLQGETPNPVRVPSGCRFHPRCPALASGEAARAGVDDRCRDQAVPSLRGVTEHHAACFLTDESVKKEAERRQSTRGAHAEGPQ
jgi:oligopeptide/dipeptide ABC transporter ATP-binding protein